ncbi:hypothetical protein L7F22_000054 [Adiantum nelumboides]|nr:hypothetical protein [Adiantum nelumboides]
MDGTSLGKLAHEAQGPVDDEVGRAVVQDAFAALADVHAQGITHRALQLRSIEVTPPPQNRVRFRDLSRAHLPSAQTIAPVLADDHPSSAFQAPGTTPEFFQPGDDVYALALCLVQWLHGDAGDQPDHDRARSRATGHTVFGDLLRRCLDLDITVRPTAAEAAALTSPAPPPAPEPEPAVAVVSLSPVEDERMEPDGLLAGATACCTVSARAPGPSPGWPGTSGWSRYCARVYDVLARPAPGVLVQEYVPGQSLHDAAQNDRITDEEQPEQHHRAGGRQRRTDRLRVVDASDRCQVRRRIPALHRARGDHPAALDARRGHLQRRGVGVGRGARPLSVRGAVARRAPHHGAAVTGSASPLRRCAARHAVPGAAFDEKDRPQNARAFADEVDRARDTSPPPSGTTRLVNPTVGALRGLYRRSEIGNAGNRGMDDEFAHDTYVDTRLDDELLPAVLDGDLDVVVLSGNPGDGKTAFLVQVGRALDERGAQTLATDAAGWRKRLGGRTFAAVYDASESHGDLTADDLMRSALDPGDGDDPTRRTVLLAANDGRVAQFFGEHADRYPEVVTALDRQRADRPSPGARVVLVDLKRRALALPADSERTGLGLGILDVLTDPPRWSLCTGCRAHDVCPMRRNAALLRTDGARTALSELLLTSHLRRRRRATVRDVRSALGWVITGDLSCDAVHREYDRGQDPASGPGRLAPDLAFTPDTGDYLVDEWSELDPAGLAAPGVGRAARADRRLLPDLSAVEKDVMGALKRSLFFGAWEAPPSARREVRGYRYLDEYLAALGTPNPALPRMLLGVSRILAYPGYDGAQLALRDRAYDDPSVRAIVVVKELEAGEFRLEPAASPSPYVESFTDQLVLRHPGSNARLRVTVDVAEVLLRAADGEIVGDTASAALRQEIEGFGNRLRLQPARSVRVVDGSGRAVRATVIDGGRIALEDGS